ncbi:hypothetical protein A2U01_0058004, partial [Trifolium medium]|nr:hypothetical protein [Trifolium medium]
ARGGAAGCLIQAGSFARFAEQERNWASLWPGPEQEDYIKVTPFAEQE